MTMASRRVRNLYPGVRSTSSAGRRAPDSPAATASRRSRRARSAGTHPGRPEDPRLVPTQVRILPSLLECREFAEQQLASLCRQTGFMQPVEGERLGDTAGVRTGQDEPSQRSQSVVQRMDSSKPPCCNSRSRRTTVNPKMKLRSRIARRWSATSKRQERS
jgi:hypothetical protein